MEAYAILYWLSINSSLSYLLRGQFTVAGRLDEVPPSGLPQPHLTIARVMIGEEKVSARMLATRLRSHTTSLDLTIMHHRQSPRSRGTKHQGRDALCASGALFHNSTSARRSHSSDTRQHCSTPKTLEE